MLRVLAFQDPSYQPAAQPARRSPLTTTSSPQPARGMQPAATLPRSRSGRLVVQRKRPARYNRTGLAVGVD
jgi:hypothetical protein